MIRSISKIAESNFKCRNGDVPIVFYKVIIKFVHATHRGREYWRRGLGTDKKETLARAGIVYLIKLIHY